MYNFKFNPDWAKPSPKEKFILYLNPCPDKQEITITMVKYQINHFEINNYCNGNWNKNIP